MRLEYNILWIEDDIQEYIDNGEIDRLKEFIRNLGFVPHIETVLDESKLDDYINLYKYDLIISDFNLSSTTGDKIIEEIRINKKLDTEILFYTGQPTNFQEDPEVLQRVAFLDRVSFQVGRDTLINKIENLINLTLVKLLEINATRGLITAETSELDVEIEKAFYKILTIVQSKEDNESKLESIFQREFKKYKDKTENDLKEREHFHNEDYNAYFDSSTANPRWILMRKLLKIHCPDGFDQKLFKSYSKDVIEVRNKFAHAKAEEKDGKLVLKGQYGKEDFEYDEEACVEIRKNIIAHRENIDKLN